MITSQKITAATLLAAALLFTPYLASTGNAATGGEPTYGPYLARVLRVIDGDTIALEVAVWPGLVQQIHLRLDGVNTPEKRGGSACEKEAALRATDFTTRFLARAELVVVSGISLGKYAGRALGRIAAGGQDLGEALLTAGLARPYAGGKRKAWC